MENRKTKMPVGALIVCIMVIAFIAACITGIVLLITKGIKSARTPDMTEAPAGNTAVVTSEPTSIPSATADPLHHASAGTQATEDMDKIDIIARCMETVVSIDITMTQGSSDVYAGSGSGVLITSDGYIVTCNHVVEGSANIYVYLNDGSQYTAELIGNDPVTDIAVIKLNASGEEFPCATLGVSEGLRVGETVYAIGNALGTLSNTVTDGIISGLDRDIEIDGQSMTLLQTSAAINSGNSGGALFLHDGTLIGVVNAKTSGTTSTGATIEGLGFAVPIDLAKPIITDIMTYGYVTGRPYLGVSTKNVSYGYGMFSYTTYPQVVTVVEGSPAAKAGVRENDIIVKINGETVSSSTALRVRINSFSVGDVITLTILRGNSTIELTVKLEERSSR
ncbi:MAG: trypsin-like peptidase domain-containing protein [Clostridia bacterium]|nr:trypsin-like peptidase domain-containing protein [Clostridia bacterium]